MDLAGVSLWAGSESRRPMILQVISTSATRQKMKQLVPYIIIAGTLNTETVITRRCESEELIICICIAHLLYRYRTCCRYIVKWRERE